MTEDIPTEDIPPASPQQVAGYLASLLPGERRGSSRIITIPLTARDVPEQWAKLQSLKYVHVCHFHIYLRFKQWSAWEAACLALEAPPELLDPWRIHVPEVWGRQLISVLEKYLTRTVGEHAPPNEFIRELRALGIPCQWDDAIKELEAPISNRVTMNAVIAGLAKALAKTSNRYHEGERPNIAQISASALTQVFPHDTTLRGMSQTNFALIINTAISESANLKSD